VEYNFDEVIDRKNTNSIKYDYAAKMGMPEDVIPMWVADMDFKSPPAVSEAIIKVGQYGIFGYSDYTDKYFDVVYSWFQNRFGWKTEYEWLEKTPGVVFAISSAIRALTEPGDGILIQRPVYHPFTNLVNANKRKLVINPLVYNNGSYSIDFDDFEAKIVENSVKLFLLCSPHNPISRVWTKDELIRMGDICIRQNVIVVSDEIHCDFVYSGNKHHIFASLKDEFLDNSITCTSPSKTFNIAGLQVANTFIPNEKIRKKFRNEMKRIGYSEINMAAAAACQAAYSYGNEWLDQLNCYLEENMNLVKSFLVEEMPKVQLTDPEGTYLLWLDFRKYNLTEDELEHIIINKAKVWLNKGSIFGSEGRGFQRMNIALPRSVLRKALKQLTQAFCTK
jgi:cystathionine beta-lyase